MLFQLKELFHISPSFPCGAKRSRTFRTTDICTFILREPSRNYKGVLPDILSKKVHLF